VNDPYTDKLESVKCSFKVLPPILLKPLAITRTKTLANFLDRKTQLYEQGATVRRIGQYVRNWWRWVRAGVVISDEPSHIRARINSH